MPKNLDSRRAKELVRIVEALGHAASFTSILREAARAGILKDHKTLRIYLDLLVAGRVLRVQVRDVGSVNPQQMYRVSSNVPKVSVGLTVLRQHNLSWDVPETNVRIVSTDFDGLARSRPLNATLLASLEDCLIHELCDDARRNTGTLPFVTAIVATQKMDLPYLLRRADEMRIGRTTRLLFDRVLAAVSSKETQVSATVFFAVRDRFLQIARQYSKSGFWKLVEERGVGGLGLRTVRSLTQHEVLMAAGKQLGVIG